MAAALLLAVVGCGPQDAGNPELLFYCGAGLREPAEELVAEFKQTRNVEVVCSFEGSEHLLTRLKLTRRGDLYLPGDAYYVDQARQEGLIAESRQVCYFVPVIIVSRQTDRPPKSLADLTRPGLKIGLGDAEACAIGRITSQIFEKNGIDEADVERNVPVRSVTVNQLGNQVRLGHLDAAIVWDAVAAQFADDVRVVRIPPAQNVISHVPLGLLSCSQNQATAREFADFMTSDRGREVFHKYGYCVDPPEAGTSDS
jgi:molybdate transport system substrate-binding protein